jgi:hypothetical protein
VPDAFTSSQAATWDLLVETAFDRAVAYALRDDPQWRQVIDSKPTAQAMPGDVVTMTFIPDMALATTPLSELVDVNAPGQSPPTRVQITLNEYGNADVHTERIRQLAFVTPDPEIAEVIGRNMVDSIDAVIRSIVDPANFVLYRNSGNFVSSAAGNVPATNNLIVAADVATAKTVTAAVTLLRRRKVRPRSMERYICLMHPDARRAHRPARQRPGRPDGNRSSAAETAGSNGASDAEIAGSNPASATGDGTGRHPEQRTEVR